MLIRITAALFAVTVPFAAIADEAGAQACASKLEPESKLIYDQTSANLSPQSQLKDVIEHETRALVHDGKVSMWSARSSAESAYTCLDMLPHAKTG